MAEARSWLRRAGAWVLWSLLGLLALAASVVLHLQLPIARRVAVEFVHGAVSDEIRGALRIGTLEQVSPEAIVARDVTLFDGEGRRVVQAARLTLVPDLLAARALQVKFSAARLHGGTVWLYDTGDGLPSLLTSFDSARPSARPGGEPLHVEVSGIELQRVTLQGELLGLSGLRAEVASARGHMDIGREVHVRIDSAHGAILEPYGFEAPVDALSGTISTVPHEGVALRASVRRDGERAHARIRFASPEDDPDAEGVFELHVAGEQLTTETLLAIGLDFMPELEVPISGELEMRGPFSDLALRASLSTAAGPAEIAGTIRESGAVVSVRSPRMELAKLRAGAPDLTVSGTVHIETAPEAAQQDPRLRIELDPLVYEDFAIPAVTLHGALVEDGVRIDGAEAKTRGTTLSAQGHVSAEGAIDLRVRVHVADIGRDENLARLVPNAHGHLDADVQMQSGEPGQRAMRFAGRVTLAELRYGTLEADRLVLQGSARGDPERPALRLDLRGSRVRLGTYGLGDPSLIVRGGPRVYQAEGQFVAAGRRTFNASARIVAERGGYVVEADPVEFAVGEGSWRGAVQGLRIRPGEGVQLDLLRLASRSQRLEAKAVVRERGEDHVEAQLQDFDLAAVHALLGGQFWLQQGRADAHVTLSGDLVRPDLLIQGALRDGAVLGVQDVDALYFVTYRDGRIEADGEVDLGERGLVQLRGQGSVDPSVADPLEALRHGRYDVEVGTQALSIALAPAIAAAGVTGELNGSVRLKGTLQHPEFRGALDLDPLRVPGWSSVRIAAQGGYGAGMLSLRVSASDERGTLGSAEGQMQLAWAELLEDPSAFARVLTAGPWQVSGETIARRLDHLPEPLASAAPYPLIAASQFTLQKQDGETRGHLTWNGSWAESLGETPCAQDVEVALRGALTLLRGSTRFEFVASSGVTRVASARGTLETPVDRWIDQGRIERPGLFNAAARVNIAQIQRLPYLCEYGNGSLRAEVELDGGLSAEPLLVGVIDASLYPRMVRQDRRKPVRVRSCQGDPIRAHLEFNADRGEMRIHGGTEGCHGGPIDVRAVAPVVWDELLVLPTTCPNRELAATVRFDGAQLKPLLDRIPGVKNSDALAHGEVKLRGVVPELQASGRVEIAGGRLYLVPTGQELTEIDAALDFRGTWAKLERLTARQEQGRLESSGGIGFDGLRPERLQLAVRTDRFPVRREGLDMGTVTASAVIDAEIQPERTRAAIKLHDLHLRLPDATTRTLQPLDPHPDVAIVTATREARPLPYPIELVFEGQRNLHVQRNDFDAEVALELAIAYADPQLNVGGSVEFVGGEFEVFGKRFEINSGALRFDGGTEFNPDVYLIATQKPEGGGTSPVVVSVTGTLAEPIVTFSSDVCPGDVGAITYLVSGRCAADDPDLAQESNDTRSAVTTGLLSGVLTLGAQSQLSGALPRIAVESGGRVRAGISSQSLVPKFMRGLVQRVYVQGGVGQAQTGEAAATATEDTSGTSTLDFLIELYFPHNIVGSGRFAQESWGLDVTWEP